MKNELDYTFRAATAASILLTAAACSPQEQQTNSSPSSFTLDRNFLSNMPTNDSTEQSYKDAAKSELDSVKESCKSIPEYIPDSEFVWHANFGKEDAYRYAFCQAKTDGNMKYTMVVAYNENGKNTESIMKPLEFKKTLIGTMIYGYYDDQGIERDILKKSIDGGASSYDISGNEDLLTLQDRTNADAVISLFSLGVTPVYAMAPETETPTLTQLPTETPTPEATATITVTPTPEATATPTETATPEISPEKQQALDEAKSQFETLGVPPDQYTLSYDKDGVLIGLDSEGVEVYREGFAIEYAVNYLRQNGDLAPTSHIARRVDYKIPYECDFFSNMTCNDYISEMVNPLWKSSGGKTFNFAPLMLVPGSNSWGSVVWIGDENVLTYLCFEKTGKNIVWVLLQNTGANDRNIMFFNDEKK